MKYRDSTLDQSNFYSFFWICKIYVAATQKEIGIRFKLISAYISDDALNQYLF